MVVLCSNCNTGIASLDISGQAVEPSLDETVCSDASVQPVSLIMLGLLATVLVPFDGSVGRKSELTRASRASWSGSTKNGAYTFDS